AGIKREAHELTHRDIEALTAEWLRRQLVANEIEVRPEDEDGWRMAAGNLEEEVLGGDIEDREPSIIPARARRVVKADVDALLETEGLRVPEDSPQYEALAIKLFERKHAFAAAMATRAGGDWRQVEALERAPLWKPASDRSKTLKWAYGEWVKARKPAPRTAYEFERYIQEFGADRLVQEVTPEDIRAYRDRLLEANTTANFVDKKLTPIRSVMKWLFKEKHISSNPAPGIGVANLKQERQRKTRDGYTRDEARTLLTAARKEKGTLRWLPWVLAATGCRLNEVCQAVASDVTKEDGVWLLNVTDVGDGQRLKAEASTPFSWKVSRDSRSG
ncbi:MAG: hypothetical protein Q8M07_23230, partial [Prosthecobacter sp.]|nr:hypothetical protein [Prosthecobacter sp.]